MVFDVGVAYKEDTDKVVEVPQQPRERQSDEPRLAVLHQQRDLRVLFESQR